VGWLRRTQPRPDRERLFLDEIFPHAEGLRRYALRLTGDETAAMDLVQEALTRAYAGLETVRPGTNYRAWVFTVLRNTFLSNQRKAWRREPLTEPHAVPAPDAPPPEGAAVAQRPGAWGHVFGDEVLAALDALSEPQRSAVVLSDIEGLTYQEIAAVLDCPVGTVRSRIHHARRRLRQDLAAYAAQQGIGPQHPKTERGQAQASPRSRHEAV